MHSARRQGPGIVKVKHEHPVVKREVSLVRAGDLYWAELFSRADVVSEGAAEKEGDSWVYRGTTSIILRCGIQHALSGGRSNDASVQAKSVQAKSAHAESVLAQEARERAMEMDPHLRLRAVRVAQREAQTRAPGMLGTSQMDLLVRTENGEVRVDVEIDAGVEYVDTQHIGLVEKTAKLA